jgi:hypothetical protein
MSASGFAARGAVRFYGGTLPICCGFLEKFFAKIYYIW